MPFEHLCEQACSLGSEAGRKVSTRQSRACPGLRGVRRRDQKVTQLLCRFDPLTNLVGLHVLLFVAVQEFDFAPRRVCDSCGVGTYRRFAGDPPQPLMDRIRRPNIVDVVLANAFKDRCTFGFVIRRDERLISLHAVVCA